MRTKPPSRLIYSSETRLCPKCGWPERNCKCSESLDQAIPPKIVAKLRIEKSGRGGKTVTVVDGLPRNQDFLKALAGDLKKACGAGGKAGEGKVEIQGDKRDAIRSLLRGRGWTVKG